MSNEFLSESKLVPEQSGLSGSRKMAVLLFTGYFLPGFKGGGPIRTVANMVDKLGDEIDFSVVTSDRDLGDIHPYPNIIPNEWVEFQKAKIAYMSPGVLWIYALWRVVVGYRGDIIYLNSFFSFRHSILPIAIWRLFKPGKPIVIGPRGEFSQGALGFRKSKKSVYIFFAKLFRLYRNVTWYASSEYEAEDIRRTMGRDLHIKIAINIASPSEEIDISDRHAGSPLKIVFISRITPKKNLLAAIRVVAKVKASLVFDVYGPIEDNLYWSECEQEVDKLPAHIQFNYKGVLIPAEISDTLAGYDLFFLLTLGENFGHVIAEALGCGVPVLISDTTPWRELDEKNLGWDISLDQVDKFVAVIEKCSRISYVDYAEWRKSIRRWALLNIGNADAIEQNRQVFKNLGRYHAG